MAQRPRIKAHLASDRSIPFNEWGILPPLQGAGRLIIIRPLVAAKAGAALSPPRLSERVQAGERDLLIFVGLHTRHPDSADALILVHDRQRTLNQDASRKARERRPVLHTVLEEFTRTLGQGRSSGLADGHFGGDGAGAVHPLEAKQMGTFVDDRNRHIPSVLDGFGLAGLENFLHIGQGQAGLGSHWSLLWELAARFLLAGGDGGAPRAHPDTIE